MTVGLSGSYAINAVDICPEDSRWLPRPALGIDGNGHSIYPAVRDVELTWSLVSMADFNVIYQAYQLVGNTGTITADLPDLSASDFRFKRYSGTIIHEPEVGTFFEGYASDVRLLITNIRT